MKSSAENNKQIAKNTISLYFRQILIMAVSIYSSRVVLNALGVVDYGLYNVVGGLIALFGFLNSALAQATQRYIAFGIEKDDISTQRKTFSMLVNIHGILAIIIILLCETVGLWLFYKKLVIPEDRLLSAFWVMQCSIVTLAISVVQVPFNAAIFGHEKMNAYAYISIVEAALKLCVVISLQYINSDKLVVYGVLQLVVAILIACTYRVYCIKKFNNCHYIFYWSNKLFKELFSYTGWSLLGNFAWTFNNQGMNILINMFFGPLFNAARGIAVAVESALSSFLYNFIAASIPSIIKAYANDDLDYMQDISIRSSKVGFLLFMCLSIPTISVINRLLDLWLVNPPQYSSLLCVLSLLYVQFNSMCGTLQNVIQATGRVRDFQIVVGGLKLVIIPIVYFLYKIGYPVETYLWVLIASSFINLFIELLLVKAQVPAFSIRAYLSKVVARDFLSIIIPLTSGIYFMNQSYELLPSFYVMIAMFVLCALSAWVIGFSKTERLWIKTNVVRVCSRFINKRENE